MAWSPEISQLSTDLVQLTDAVNVKKNLLDVAVTSTQNSKIATNTSADIAANSAILSNASTQIANIHKNSTLSIYGTQSAQQASLNIASRQASIAATSAIAATAGLTQDLSGVTAQALHRSPNAITSMFVYDTSKDSDGGAWTEKCQHTSWYNEPTMNKWLGSEVNEIYARYVGATVGSELIGDPDLNNPSYWFVAPYLPTNFTITNGQAIRANDGNAAGLPAPVNLTAGKTYRVRVQLTNTRPTISNATVNNYGSISVSAGVAGLPFNVTSLSKSGNPGESIDLYITPSINTNYFVIYSNTNSYANIEAISCKEVVNLTALSGDYFQLTTDGKFYRLWRNFLGMTERLTDSFWIKNIGGAFNGGGTGSRTVTDNYTAHDGQLIASRVQESASNEIQGVIPPNTSSTLLGLSHVFTIDLKADTRTQAFVGHIWDAGTTGIGQGSWIVIDLTNGTQIAKKEGLGNADSSLLSCISLGNGWYRATVRLINVTNNATLRPVFGPASGGVGIYQGDGASGILIARPHVEIGTTEAIYEKKSVAQGRLGEVFRGNKRDFPRLAGIIAEGANVNIYDLTEPGRPMWMRFTTGTSTILGWYSNTPTVNGMSALNGTIAVALSQGGVLLQFPKDDMRLLAAATICADVVNRSIANRRATGATRSTNNTTTYDSFAVANLSEYVITMIVLPDAPIDPVTSLKVPTIAVATAGGVSVIKHNGTVVMPYGGDSPYAEFTNDYRLRCKRGGTSAFYISSDWRTAAVPTAPLTLNATSAIPNISLNSGNKGFYAKKQSFMYYSGAGEVAILQENPGTYAKGFVARVTNGFNTGWMHGDIRRTYLSDTETGSVTGPELVTNGTFDTNTTGWAVNFAGATLSWDTIRASAKVVVSGIGQGITQTSWTPVVGRWYRITFTVTNGAAVSRGFAVTFAAGGGDVGSVNPGQTRTFTVTVFATSTANLIVRNAGGDTVSGETFFYDNISVREVVLDRSYKAQSAYINGIVTRSQVASGTSLVGYSGFSTTNYLQEPYSSELDFGTGEWSASTWVNIPATLPTTSFPVIDTNLIINGDFSNGTTNWAVNDPNAVTIAVIDGRIRVTALDTLIRWAWQSFPTVIGKTYELSFDYDSGTATGITFSAGSSFGSGDRIATTGRTGAGTAKALILATSTTTWTTYGTNSNNAGKQVFFDNISVREVSPISIFNRAHTSGSRINLGVNSFGNLTAEAFDGTTSRIVTTKATYNNTQWLKAEANYTTDGSLAIRVNGREVAVARGNPLLSLNSRRNLLTYTEQFNTLWNMSRLTVSPDVIIAPDGSLSADAVFETAASGIHETTLNQGAAVTSGSPYTISIYAKSNGRSRFRVQFDLSRFPNNQVFFDLSTGAPDNIIGGTASMVPLPNGWYRCIFTMTAVVTSPSAYPFYIAFVDSAVNTGYLGDVTKGLYLWGAQFEFGTVATLYQRVSAAAETNVAPLTIGNSFTANAPFPGSIALLKLGATVPTPEQSAFIYEQEKQLFRPGALSVLPDATTIVDMSYDDATDRWAAISTTNESYWNGLVRSSVTAVPAGSYSKVATTSGIELVSRITTNPGVDVTIPPYALREELVKKSEAASRLARKTVTYDYTGGFTGNITIGSTSILSVAGLTYPTSYIGARISGTGIPANTTITGVSGTTIYISAPATATTTTLTITFLDFNLPVGMETKNVLSAGVIKRRGTTSDYTRLFDGFIETIRFAVAPGSTTWVQIQATRTTQ